MRVLELSKSDFVDYTMSLLFTRPSGRLTYKHRIDWCKLLWYV